MDPVAPPDLSHLDREALAQLGLDPELAAQQQITLPEPGAIGPLLVGVDVGQRRDFTAVSVVEPLTRQTSRREREWLPSPYGGGEWAEVPVLETLYVVRFMERLALGQSYPAIVERVAAIVNGAITQQAKSAYERDWKTNGVDPRSMPGWSDYHRRVSTTVYVDSTGVGSPVVELLEHALAGSVARIVPLVFTFGPNYITTTTPHRLGKEFLVSRLMVLFQTKRILLPRGSTEAQAMRQELLDYEIRVDPDGDAKFGAFKVGAHDDLVTSLGLAVLTDPHAQRIRYLPDPFDW